MGSKVLGPIGAVLGIGVAVKNMYDIIDATMKGEAYDPSHVRGQGINVNMGDVVQQGGPSGEQVWESVKGQFISAWNAAMSGTAVAGAMGGACNSGSTPR